MTSLVVILVFFFLLQRICFLGLWEGTYIEQVVVCFDQLKAGLYT